MNNIDYEMFCGNIQQFETMISERYLHKVFTLSENAFCQQYILMTFIPEMISLITKILLSVLLAVATLSFPTACAMIRWRGIMTNMAPGQSKPRGPISIQISATIAVVNVGEYISSANASVAYNERIEYIFKIQYFLFVSIFCMLYDY